MSAAEEKLSRLESIKAASRQLRGSIAAQLAEESDFFDRDNVQVLKHHGMYQQDDRDARSQSGSASRAHSFLVRTRVPGGRLTSSQLLAELDLCDEVGNGTLRITARQGLQLHGVLKTDLRRLARRLDQVALTTLGACGDVNRNVMACPAPATSHWDHQLRDLSLAIARHFAPRTGAYRELWLQDPETLAQQRVALGTPVGAEPSAETEEPFYGRAYLPRKFKFGMAFPWDNCIDVHTHDLGLLAITEDRQIVGFNALVGGGMGMTPANKNTFPALAQPLGFVPLEDVIRVAESVVRVQRDFGNRCDRKTARLKYLIHRWGIDAFRDKVVEYLGTALQPARPVEVHATCNHLGWHEQEGDRWYYGLNIENGRILDRPGMALKSALREVCRRLDPGIHLTAYQKLLFTNIKPGDRGLLESILAEHSVVMTEQTSMVRRWAMACVAWPTCGLAITESERALPGVLDELERVLARFDLGQEEFTVRMTGCPNGCVRPYNADIGLVGKARDAYTIYVGGNVLGTQLGWVYADRVPLDRIVATIRPLLAYFRQAHSAGERFGEFCHRRGKADLQAWVDQNVSSTGEGANPEARAEDGC